MRRGEWQVVDDDLSVIDGAKMKMPHSAWSPEPPGKGDSRRAQDDHRQRRLLFRTRAGKAAMIDASHGGQAMEYLGIPYSGQLSSNRTSTAL